MGLQYKRKNGKIIAYIAVIYNDENNKNDKTSYMYSVCKYGKYAEILALKSLETKEKIYNYYTENENYYILHLYSNKYDKYYECLIDKEDYVKIKDMYWGLKEDLHKKTLTFYVHRSKDKLKLHRFLLNPKNDMVVDHINGNTLDNRKTNLREVTNSENIRNRPNINSNNTSGTPGVSFDSSCNSWTAVWRDKNFKIHKKSFSVNKYGNDEAKQLAIETRTKNNYM